MGCGASSWTTWWSGLATHKKKNERYSKDGEKEEYRASRKTDKQGLVSETGWSLVRASRLEWLGGE